MQSLGCEGRYFYSRYRSVCIGTAACLLDLLRSGRDRGSKWFLLCCLPNGKQLEKGTPADCSVYIFRGKSRLSSTVRHGRGNARCHHALAMCLFYSKESKRYPVRCPWQFRYRWYDTDKKRQGVSNEDQIRNGKRFHRAICLCFLFYSA